MRNRCFLFILSFLFAARLAAQDTYSNPIIDRSLPDPTVIRDGDGTYWLYATEDIHNVPIYKSLNLLDWEYMGAAFTDATRPQMVPGGGIWAPEINYVNGKWLLYYSKSKWGGTWECGIGVATANVPCGPFTDHGKLFISSEIDVENSIDPFLFTDDDGRNYLFWGSFHGIYGIELTADGLAIKEGAEKQQVASGFMEATNIIKRNGWYLLIGSQGSCCEGAKSTYQVVINRSRNLFGPYVNRSGNRALSGGFSSMLSGNTAVAGPGHNSRFVQDDAGTDWMIYHGYLKKDPDAGRVTFMDPIVWDRAGWPTVKNNHPSASAARPVIDPALHMGDEGKSQVPLADPFILLDGDTYYAYGTHAADGIEVYTSTDLQTWTLGGLALDKRNTTATQWFWAPEVYKRGDTYYMYYSAEEHLFVATSSSPTGPFVQQGGYLLQALIGDEKCIDGTVYTNEDGKMYLFFVRFTDGNVIWSCDLADDGLGPAEGTSLRRVLSATSGWERKLGKVAEGPFIVPYNGKYYLTYSANDFQSPWYGVGYATSSNLERGWTKYRYNPVVQNVEGLFGTGHHSFFTDKEGRMRIVFHAHHGSNAVYPRRMYIGTMAFDGDGVLTLTPDSLIRPRLEGGSSVSALQAEPVTDEFLFDTAGRRLTAAASGKGIRIRQSRNGKTTKIFSIH